MSDAEMLSEGTLTVRKAVEFSGLGRTKLYELMDAGKLPFVRFGPKRLRLIPKRALAEMLAADLVRRPG